MVRALENPVSKYEALVLSIKAAGRKEESRDERAVCLRKVVILRSHTVHKTVWFVLCRSHSTSSTGLSSIKQKFFFFKSGSSCFQLTAYTMQPKLPSLQKSSAKCLLAQSQLVLEKLHY